MHHVLTIALAAILFFAMPAHASLTVGQDAPDFTLEDQAGTSHSLSDFKGKLVVLEWFNYGCPFVKKHYNSENMQSLQKQYTDKEVVWLAITSSAEGKQGHLADATAANAIYETKGLNATALLRDPSGEVGKLYGAKATPHMYVINAEGKLAYMGAIDSIPSAESSDVAKADNYVSSALDALLAGEPVAKPVTSPYGCSVKY